MRLVHYKPRVPNFGDELNAVLWPALAPGLFTEPGEDGGDRTGFLGIGTIIGMPTPPGCDFLHVFSSGLGYDRLEDWRIARRVWCVRGPLTAGRLGAPEAALTDGAVLAPYVLGPVADPAPVRGAACVMPHWESLEQPGWEDACAQAGLTLISPVGPPEQVIAQIRQASLLVTESLHGAILADTYGIPWVPIATTRNFSLFKWVDWTMSVGIAPLRVRVVAPPSIDALLRFGRPAFGGWDADVAIDPGMAVREYETRIAQAATSAPGAGGIAGAALRPRQGLRDRAVRALRSGLERSAAGRGAFGRVLGLSPARTAAALQRAAASAPLLSSEGHCRALQDRMLERLEALRRSSSSSTAAAGPVR